MKTRGTLRICLNEELPPFSVRNNNAAPDLTCLPRRRSPSGLDIRSPCNGTKVSSTTDASSTIEANALLSDGRCDLFAGYPLVKDALGKPGRETARLPDFAGARPSDRRRRVALGTLAPTTPYHFAGLSVVLAGKATGQAHREPRRS